MPIFLAVFAILKKSTCDEISFVLLFARHGARMPTKHSRYVDRVDRNYPVGELVPSGMKMNYLLSQKVIKEYPFLKDSELDSKSFMSSYKNRTIISAASFVLGMKGLEKGPLIEADVPELYNPPIKDFDIKIEGNDALPHRLAPITFMSPSDDDDYIFQHSCPDLDEELEKVKKDNIELIKDTFQPLYKLLIEEGFQPSDFIKNEKFKY